MSAALSHHDRKKRRERIALDIKHGMTVSEAASKHGVSMIWVRRACIENGVTLPSYHKVGVVKVVACLIRDWPHVELADIGRECSLSRERVRQIQEQCLRYNILKEEHDEHPARDQEVGAAGR